MKRLSSKKINVKYILGIFIGISIIAYIVWSIYSNIPLRESAITTPKNPPSIDSKKESSKSSGGMPIWAIVAISIGSVIAFLVFIRFMVSFMAHRQELSQQPGSGN